MKYKFKHLFKKSIKKINIKSGSIIKAKIIDIKNNNVIVDSGLKSESYIPIEEFKNNKGKIKIKIKDKVKLYIDNFELYGETILSREKAKKLETWNNLEISYTQSNNIKGIITGRVKGGFTVDINGIKSFLPGSLIDIKPIKDISILEGKILDFKVIKLDKKNNNIVLSRKAAIINDNNIEKKKLLKKIYKGSKIKGIVKNLTDYGAFIDLGALDGLLHITDISWKRIKHPKEILNIGQKIKTKVIKFDKEKIRVSLGLKQLTKDPWKNIEKKYPKNKKVKGKITNLTDYGCFIEIEEGIEGLAHISEIDWINKNINPFKIFNIGDKIKSVILNIDIIKRRISLGIKQCKPNPWIIFSKKYKNKDIIKGKIKSITDFGIFIELEGGIDGLIHSSDISWNIINNENIKNKYKKGEFIKAIILQINAEKERISLGIKQLKEDPINIYKKYKDKIIISKITKIEKNILKVIIDNKIEGLINIKNKKNINKYNINNILKTKIISIDENNRILNLKIIKNKNKNNKRKIFKNKNCFNTMVEAFKKAKSK